MSVSSKYQRVILHVMSHLAEVAVNGDKLAEVGGRELGGKGEAEKEGIPGPVPHLACFVHVWNQLCEDEKLGLQVYW